MDHHNSSLILDPSLSLVFGASVFPSLLFPFLSLRLSSSHPPFLQFIFQFVPRSSQVCARRKFAEAAGAPLEATWRRDRRGTIRPSPPLLSLPLVLSLSHVPFSPFPPSFFFFSLTLVSSLSRLSLSPACQATQVLRVTCFWLGSLSTEPSPLLLHPLLPPNSSFCSCLPLLSLHSPLSFSSTLLGGKTVRPSSPELSISKGVYLQRDRLTHLERIFTSVHTLSL